MKILLTLLLLPVLAFAKADDPPGHGHGHDGGEVSVENIALGGEQVIKNTALGLSQSLGDVDLGRAAECVITEQYGLIIWQRQNWEYDPWCIARILDGQGKHYEAAQMRCSHKPTAKLFRNDCVDTLTFSTQIMQAPPALEPVKEPIILDKDEDEDKIRYSALLQRVEEIEEYRQTAVLQYNRNLREIQRQRVEETRKKTADREFAQQTLDELAEYYEK